MTRTETTPSYYVSAGRKNVKLNQRDLSVDSPAYPYGPFLAFDKLNRKVTVYAQNAELANVILDHWRGRMLLNSGGK